MNQEKSIEVLAGDRLASGKKEQDEQEFVYLINKQVSLELSYGVTALSIKAFTPNLGKKTLLFLNDLSLKKVFDTEDVSFDHIV